STTDASTAADAPVADDAPVAAPADTNVPPLAEPEPAPAPEPEAPAAHDGAREERDDDGRTDGIDAEDERQSFGEGNRRGRRRRRGRGGEDQPGGDARITESQGEPIPVEGLLDLRPEGYGFLRGGGYLPAQKDVYVSASQVRRFALRKGDFVTG